ncbi:MAG: HD domain-containing protein [Candidatus Nanoarchaeia archaeon]|nr:HD domain-containing protein [Candidatus Nanoarchaeia archaeon]
MSEHKIIIDILNLAEDCKALDYLRILKQHNEASFNHSLRVALFSYHIADNFLKGDALDAGLSGLLHDIGKIYISPAILDKEGPLLNYESFLIHSHPVQGEVVLRELGVNDKIRIPALKHHRLSKKPYPSNTKILETDPVDFINVVSAADRGDVILFPRKYNGDNINIEGRVLDEFMGNKEFIRYILINKEKYTKEGLAITNFCKDYIQTKRLS